MNDLPYRSYNRKRSVFIGYVRLCSFNHLDHRKENMNLKLANAINLLSQKWCNWNSHRKYGDHFPGMIHIETSTVCNRSCYYCANSTDAAKKQSYMSVDTMNALNGHLKRMNWSGRIAFHFFNEPLLDPYLDQLVSVVNRVCPRSRLLLFTNADHLTEARAHWLIQSGIDQFWITQHPPSPIGWLNHVKWLESVYPRHIVLRNLENSRFLSNHAGRSAPKNPQAQAKCGAVRNVMQILYNGDVALCCSGPRRLVQGNIHEQSLLDIWRNSPLRKMRELARAGSDDMSRLCKICLMKTK